MRLDSRSSTRFHLGAAVHERFVSPRAMSWLALVIARVKRERRVLHCAMWCFALAAPSAVYGQPADAPAEAAAQASSAGVQAPALPLTSRIEALETLASGALPKVPLEQLLEVSLDDDSSMVAHDDELRRARRDMLVAVRQARRLNAKSEAELAEMEAQILAIDLERKVLGLPIEVRERLVSLDASRDESGEQQVSAVPPQPARAERGEKKADAAHERSAQGSTKPAAAHGVKSEPARGHWYAVLLQLSLLAAVLIPLWLVRRRTGEICDAYLRVRSEGALAASVRAYRERWFGFAPALVACAALVPSMLTRRPQRLVLERSRDTLGVGSSKREPQAGQGASAVRRDAAELPPPARDAFTLEPVCDDSPLLVERFPGLDEFRQRFESWRRHERADATLIVGKAGIGKTTWLHAAARLVEGVPVSYLSLRTRTTMAADVRKELARAAGISEKAAESTEALCQALRDAPRRVMWIDDLQHWFLRRPGGLDGWRELERVIVASGSHVCWLGSMSHYTHAFVQWATRSASAFRNVVNLGGWSEAEIEDLLARRAAQSGFQVSYDEVVLDGLGRVAGTARDYCRAICADAGGSPRAAVERSLACLTRHNDTTLTMRLSRAPSPAELEGFSDVARFALAATAWHGRIGIEELSETLRVSGDDLRLELDELRGQGVVIADADQIAIAASWWPAVTRHLERHHLVGGQTLA